MSPIEPAPTVSAGARPRRGGAAYGLRTVAWVLLAVFVSLLNLVYSPLGAAEPGVLLVLLAFPAALATPILLCWRRRAPLTVTFVSAAVGILLPIGAATAAIALVSAFKRRGGAPVWWATLAVTVTMTAAVLRDLATPPTEGLFGSIVNDPQSAPQVDSWLFEVSWYVPVVLVVVMMTLVVGTGLLTRARTRTRRAEQRTADAQARQDRLGGALARQQERERIAREVHDGLGQRLSIVAMHAGALSLAPGLSDDARQTADLLRGSAAEAAADLRALLRVLRQNEELPPVPLTRLGAFIAEAEQAGLPVRATVDIAAAGHAPAPLGRAVVRIVQELLNNAGRHAGGELLHLQIRGGPPDRSGPGGIAVHSQNLLPTAETVPAPPSGFGLQGIAERVERLGGHLQYGIDASGTSFITSVRLPWSTTSGA